MALRTSPVQLEALCQESQQSSVLAMQWVCTTAAVVVISLRLYCRTKYGKGFGWDDYIFFAGAVGSVPFENWVSQTCTDEAGQIVGLPGPFFATKWVHTGLGKHVECLGPDRAYATVQWSIASQAHHTVCLGFVKVSLCLCILRIIDKVERRIATFLWVNIALVCTIHVAQLAMLLAGCRPLNALWSPRVRGSCYSPNTIYTTTYVAFSLDAFTDLVCSGIPIFVIYRMQMSTRTKVALCVLMGLGVLWVFSIQAPTKSTHVISSTAMCAVAEATSVKEIWSRDFTWNQVVLVKWACAEQALSLILVSLPFLRPFFRNLFKLSKSGRCPPKALTVGGEMHWKQPPNYALLENTNSSHGVRKGNNTPYMPYMPSAPIQDEYANTKFPQIPLATYLVERPAALGVRARYADLESPQWAGP